MQQVEGPALSIQEYGYCVVEAGYGSSLEAGYGFNVNNASSRSGCYIYRDQMILGKLCSIPHLREFLAHIRVSANEVTTSPTTKGLASIALYPNPNSHLIRRGKVSRYSYLDRGYVTLPTANHCARPYKRIATQQSITHVIYSLYPCPILGQLKSHVSVIQIKYREMETEDGSGNPKMSAKPTIARQVDWASFKRRIKAAGIFSGIKETLKMGEEIAANGITPRQDPKIEAEKWEEHELQNQSEKLAALLLLSLDMTNGPQQSLVINRSEETENNGILMWSDLIKHFEKASKEVRMSTWQKDWEHEILKTGEHPNELYGRLIMINSKLKGLDAGYTADQLKMRFASAMEQNEDGTYANAIQQYRSTQIGGSGWDLEILLEFLTHVYETRKPRETLRHPALLYARLVSVQRQMAMLGEVLTDNNLTEKFITAVQEGEGRLYNSVISGYNRERVMGRNQTIERLLELMSIEFRLAQQTPRNAETMVGLSYAEQCTHCRKLGHCAEDCWGKHPDKRPVRNRAKPKI